MFRKFGYIANVALLEPGLPKKYVRPSAAIPRAFKLSLVMKIVFSLIECTSSKETLESRNGTLWSRARLPRQRDGMFISSWERAISAREEAVCVPVPMGLAGSNELAR